jgi:hypothetical protein
MDSKHISLESLFEKAEEYGKTSVEILKLKAIDKSADLVSSIFIRLLLLVLISFCFSLLNIGLSLWLGEFMGKSYYGFLVVGGVYALIALLMGSFLKTYIKVLLNDLIINIILGQKQK